MPQYQGTVEEFEAAAGGLSNEDLVTYLEDDDRVGVRDAAHAELGRRPDEVAAAVTAVTFEAHMAQDGSVVVDSLAFDNPDFLAAAAQELLYRSALAATRHASELARGTS